MMADRIKEQTKQFEEKQKDILDMISHDFKLDMEQQRKSLNEEFYIKLKAQEHREVEVNYKKKKLRKQE